MRAFRGATALLPLNGSRDVLATPVGPVSLNQTGKRPDRI